jgi:hypothetical protein
LIESVKKLENEKKLIILKSFNNILSDPSTLENFEICHGIPLLISYLSNEKQEIVHQSLTSLLNLCKLNKRRQEIAIDSNIISPLQQIINDKDPLMNIAFDLLYDLLHIDACSEIFKNNGIHFLLSLLNDENFRVYIFNVLSYWSDKINIQSEIMKTKNFKIFIDAFSSMKSKNFIEILGPIYKILSNSPKLNTALSSEISFLGLIIQTLKDILHLEDTSLRLSFLKLFQLIYKYCDNPKIIAGNNTIYNTIKLISNEKQEVLVSTSAKSLLKYFDENIKF